MIDIVFPNYETMLGIYPWIKKAKILIIIAWLIRWIEMLTKKRKSSLIKLKKLNINKKQLNQLERLFTKIGLH